ncbi:MAG: transglutaminase domain-containing protein [Candidatus Bathyarchaeota archaeon]
MNRLQKAAVAVACILCSVLFLALSIDAVGEVPTLKELQIPNKPSLPEPKPDPDTTHLDDRQEQGEEKPLLRIHGPTETSYLRLVPYDRYLSGTWETLESPSTLYEGGAVDLPVETYLALDEVTFTVEPFTDLGRYLPSAPNTVSMSLTEAVRYLTEKQVFTTVIVKQTYNLTYIRFTFSEEQMRDAQTVNLPEYLEVPGYLKEDLRALAEEITAGDTTPYEKLVSLRDYLMDHYQYNMSCPQAPPGTDPLEYFLFESGEGVCIHFNTALTMMARVLGIPARLVGGYLIDPDAILQEVYPIQQHAFTEIPFQGLGWIIFDATPGAGTSPTFDVVPGDGEPNDGSGQEQPVEAPEKPLEPILPPSDDELFRLYGVTGTSYLRDGVATYYNGSWYVHASSSASYQGHYIERVIEGYQDVEEYHFFVEFTAPTGGYLPVPLYTRQLNTGHSVVFYSELELFYTAGGGVTGYEVVSEVYSFTESTLADAEPYLNPVYLQVPEALNSSLWPLANRITESPGSTYAKVKALEHYLKTSYTYNQSQAPAPRGEDPVAWFLFDSRQGVCTDFNSALVLLARSIGVPSRLVTGFLVRSDAEAQVVRGRQAHAYAEVLFDGLGWITFDASPSSEGEPLDVDSVIQTFTNITQQDEYVLVGSRFNVAGTVVDETGSPVSGLCVLVYLKQNKAEPGALAGKTVVEDGFFNASCLFPVGLAPGEYMVDAHTMGDETYLGSWSDPPIVSYMETGFVVQAPDEVVTGRRFNVTGVLIDKPANRTITGAACVIEIGGRKVQAVTDAEGRISLEASLDEAGTHTLRLSWDGSGYLLGASTVKTVQSHPLGFTLVDSELVRGESSPFSGVIHAGATPGAFEAVTASVLGGEISTVTDESGGFKIVCRVPGDHELGPLPISLTLHSSQLSVSSSLTVRARPHISFSGGGSVRVGQTSEFRLVLYDDHESSIPGAPISVSIRHGDELKECDLVTDQEGRAAFTVGASTETPENLVYEARYPGTGEFLPAMATGSVSVMPAQMPLSSATLIALLAAAGAGGLLLLKRRWDEKGEDNVAEPSGDTLMKGLSINFPGIEASLPNVWSFDEELEIHVRLTVPDGAPIPGGSIELALPGTVEHLSTDDRGEATTKALIKEKGSYQVSAKYLEGGMKTSQSLRVVDYREEVVALFNHKFREARERFKSVRDNHTARELMGYLKKETPEAAHPALENMVFLFEEASYSLHPVQRGVYMRFYEAKTRFEEAI